MTFLSVQFAILILHNSFFRMLAQAAARMACAKLDTIPVYTMSGEKKTMELKPNDSAAQFINNLLTAYPDNLQDPKKNER